MKFNHNHHSYPDLSSYSNLLCIYHLTNRQFELKEIFSIIINIDKKNIKREINIKNTYINNINFITKIIANTSNLTVTCIFPYFTYPLYSFMCSGFKRLHDPKLGSLKLKLCVKTVKK